MLPAVRAPRLFAALFAPLALLFAATPATATCDTSGLSEGTPIVEFTLTNGTLCLEMLIDDAPINVANFVDYVERGEYDGSLFHRFVLEPTPFVLQGGDERRDGNGGYEKVPKRDDEDVQNEPCTRDSPGPFNPGTMVCSVRGNERGTVAAAKLSPSAPGGGPDSASTNFFINLADNRENLDNQNGGFTVYARVLGNGMDLVDALHNPTSYQLQAVPGPLAGFPQTAVHGDQGVGTYSGCFDPNGNAGAVLDPDSFSQPGGPFGKLDPRDGSFPFLLATSCGAAPIALGDFVANPCSGVNTSVDELSLGFNPRTQRIEPFPAVYFSHSCAAADQFFAAVDDARNDASYQAAYEAQVVHIESAKVTSVPEPSSLVLTAAAGASLFALKRRARQRHQRSNV
jgi:cyclophilin family peptidyl-prolyl cis-trans isomerase